MLRGRPARKDLDYSAYNEFNLCRAMGWTYTQLMEQPQHRIEEALTFLRVEAQAKEATGGT